ncbi:MAG: DUF881 domain-containing protein [Clostridia bacterium]|nr:DUF881 domain-containing protein [Clostridia bacterium]
MKLKKASKSLIISIAITAFVLGLTMAIQFKTVTETDIAGIELMREAELRTELASWKSKYEDAKLKIAEDEQKIENYTREIEDNNNISELLAREVYEAETIAGYTDVSGPGIIVTLEDTDQSQITAEDLMSLVNELKLAGAEAISINDQRIISVTDISNINYQFIMVNTSRDLVTAKIDSPYYIKAIGNQKYLESSISIKYGFLDSMESSGKIANYVLDDNITIFKYNGTLEYKYASTIED